MKRIAKKVKKKDILLVIFILAVVVLSLFNLLNNTIQLGVQRWYYATFPSESSKHLKKINIFSLAHSKEKLRETIRVFGAKRIMEKLVHDSGGGSRIDCHRQAHTIGNVSFEIYKAQAFRDGNSACHSGFYHGAMEKLLQERGTENLAATINEICRIFKTNFTRFECLHGVGHGLLAYEDYDLPQAIRDCNLFPDDYTKNSCYGGLFMENIVTGQGNGARDVYHTTNWLSRDPYYPCNKIDKSLSVQYQCYQMQTSWMLTLTKYDFNKVISQCLAAPENMRAVCFKSFGRDISGSTLRDSNKILSLCGFIKNDEYYTQCIIGALNVIVDFWGPTLKNQADEFCEKVPERGKYICSLTLYGRKRDLTDPI